MSPISPNSSTTAPIMGGDNKIYNFVIPFFGHYYSILNMSTLSSAVEKKNFKEMKHFDI